MMFDCIVFLSDVSSIPRRNLTAPTLGDKYGENWPQLRLRPLGLQNFHETGGMSKGGGSVACVRARKTRDTSFLSFPFGKILQILPSEPSLDYVSDRYTVGFHRPEVYHFHISSKLLLQPLDQSLMAFF